MADVLQWIIDDFWNEDVWLPPNVTWQNIAANSNTNIQYPNSKDLYIPIPLAFLLTGLRYCLERFWFTPLGILLGVKNKKQKKALTNAILERAYLSNKNINNKQIQGLAKQLDWTEREVERWLRVRRNQSKPPRLVKFCESAWRGLFYTTSSVCGIITLWDKPWLWDINECWHGYPHQSITDGMRWHCMILLAFYWASCICQFFDVKRKDFWEMFVHYLITITAMCFLWITNMFRIGSLVIVVYDCADGFAEAAKMAKYVGYHKTAEFIFVVFTVLWVITRLGVFPVYIIHNSLVEFPNIVGMYPAYYIFNGLYVALLILQIFWTYFILKVIYKAVKMGTIKGDPRSSSSGCSED